MLWDFSFERSYKVPALLCLCVGCRDVDTPRELPSDWLPNERSLPLPLKGSPDPQ